MGVQKRLKARSPMGLGITRIAYPSGHDPSTAVPTSTGVGRRIDIHAFISDYDAHYERILY